MGNVIKSATTISNGTIKRNNFVIGVDTSVDYGPTSATTFWNGTIPPSSGYTVYAQKSSGGPSIRVAENDSELITIANQCGGTNITTVYDALSYFNDQSNYMVTNIDYPNIVTSGLTLMLDAGFIPSYPTTGTTWNDLSENNYNGTLINDPIFNSANGGSIALDGTNEYINTSYNLFTGTDSSNPITIAFYINPDSSQSVVTNSPIWIGTGYYSGFGLQYTGAIYRIWMRVSGGTYAHEIPIQPNVFQYVVLIWGGYDNPRIYSYLNGSLYSNQVVSNTNFSSDLTSYPFRIGAPFTSGGSTATGYFKGKIANVQIYDRAISASEVLQNYNALNSRFGL